MVKKDKKKFVEKKPFVDTLEHPSKTLVRIIDTYFSRKSSDAPSDGLEGRYIINEVLHFGFYNKLDTCNLSQRANNLVLQGNIKTLGELCDYIKKELLELYPQAKK